MSVAIPEEKGLARRIDKAALEREAELESYSDLENYRLTNSRLRQMAVMTVRADYRQNIGTTFRLISEKGPPILQNRVFKPLLMQEERMSHGEAKRNGQITSANYEMRVTGTADVDNRPCYIVDLIPKRKRKYLLVGRAWVLVDDYSIVRIEGKTAAGLSFWTGKAFILREYEDIDGFWVAKKTRATTKNWLTGRSELTIDHGQYEIVARSHPVRK